MQSCLLFSLILTYLRNFVQSDTIADCRFDDFIGTWRIDVYAYNKNCNSIENPKILKTNQVSFSYPNIVKNAMEQNGVWTMIYNQGCELEINTRKYLLMSWYNSTHYSCQKTIGHWTYTSTSKDWYCARAIKMNVDIKYHPKKQEVNNEPIEEEAKELNESTLYPNLQTTFKQKGISLKHIIKDVAKNLPKRKLTPELTEKIASLPEAWDWRTVKHPSGKSYVSPIRNQLSCGSCYAFASMAAAEARVRIVTNMTETPIFSPQDIVDCSTYSQGCGGGFPYLVAGKYAQDFGLVEEECNPYTGKEKGVCNTKQNCKRYYFTNYEYVGGYDGASNENIMMVELIENGPFPVSIEAYKDLKKYQGGIYIHKEDLAYNDFDPFVETNHVVVIVGYGYDKIMGLPYWIVKNSWGSDWGENGFFRVLKGQDEISIESLAVKFDYIYY